MAAANTLAHRLAQAAVQAMQLEVACSPKPGLVDAFNSGAHQDMDQAAFGRSIAALEPHLLVYAKAGEGLDLSRESYLKAGLSPDQALKAFDQLQKLGLAGEEASLAANQGVNCHAGLNFAWALVLPAAQLLNAWEIRQAYPEEICRLVSSLAKPAYLSWQQGEGQDRPGGARLAAAQGYPLVLNPGLASLRAWTPESSEADRNFLFLVSLVRLMAVNPDTNILRRGGEEGLRGVQGRAQDLLRGFQLSGKDEPAVTQADQRNFLAALQDFDCEMIEQNLSPGGSADLLALAIFFRLLEFGFID